MVNLDSYTVYNKLTNYVVLSGTFVEIEDYLDNPCYAVIWNVNGMNVSEN